MDGEDLKRYEAGQGKLAGILGIPEEIREKVSGDGDLSGESASGRAVDVVAW